ncbi:MAG: GIY-YIG nuclease family protein [Christensenellaceae bacterium]|jgi:hypothetical protein|nr:GIY-YIG nuclease family protein [Christensenellaceae bacterium]
MEFIIIGIVAGLALLALAIFLFLRNKKKDEKKPKEVEVKEQNIAALAAFVQAQKEQQEEELRLKDLKKAEMKTKLETFKQTKEQLKGKLRNQIDQKEWKPLEAILKSADKGGVGIYIIYNETKNKYYVGQAKQLLKRVRDHFAVEEIAKDFMSGDKMQVKFLTANELDSDYRLDHIEKTGIEIFDAETSGYNKTAGNL